MRGASTFAAESVDLLPEVRPLASPGLAADVVSAMPPRTDVEVSWVTAPAEGF
jgi:hypothetical protein